MRPAGHAQLHAVVDVVVVAGESCGEATHGVEHRIWRQHARRSHTGDLAPLGQHAVAPRGVAGQAEADVVERCAVGVAGVLQGAVLEHQLGADGADAVAAGVEHQLQPVGADHLGVVVQQQEMVARCVRGAEVDDRGEVERLP